MNNFKDFYLKTGENIRKYRNERNYSLQDVAKKIGITKKPCRDTKQGKPE